MTVSKIYILWLSSYVFLWHHMSLMSSYAFFWHLMSSYDILWHLMTERSGSSAPTSPSNFFSIRLLTIYLFALNVFVKKSSFLGDTVQEFEVTQPIQGSKNIQVWLGVCPFRVKCLRIQKAWTFKHQWCFVWKLL